MRSWLNKILVITLSAALMIGGVIGGNWLLHHPMPQGGWMPIMMVAGLGATVYGARKRGG